MKSSTTTASPAIEMEISIRLSSRLHFYQHMEGLQRHSGAATAGKKRCCTRHHAPANGTEQRLNLRQHNNWAISDRPSRFNTVTHTLMFAFSSTLQGNKHVFMAVIIKSNTMEKAVSSSFQYGSGVHLCGKRSGPQDVGADSILILDIALIATQI